MGRSSYPIEEINSYFEKNTKFCQEMLITPFFTKYNKRKEGIIVCVVEMIAYE